MMNRSTLVKMCCRTALPLLLGITAVSCSTRSHRPALPPPARYEFTDAQMGVPWRIVLYARDTNSAARAARAAFSRVAALNQVLSDYETDSELNRLCYQSGSGRPVRVGDDLWQVLSRAHLLARQTGGAFDPTVGPVAALWRKARRESSLPNAALLEELLLRVGYENMVLFPETQSVELLVKDMRLDLGGIAKGYALDEALKTIQRNGITRALISAGGDMVAGEAPPDRKGWRIEVAPLDVAQAPPTRFVWLRHMALATSGDLFQHLEIGGIRYSHIVDPRTGVGLTDRSLVTVIARTGMTADSLATAVSVMGPREGLELVEETPYACAYIVRAPGQRLEAHASRRFPDYVVGPGE